ncbi:MAG: nitronate monooxygenase [Planctomycetes bacterium]|nr:nitronate monooxygenase [Planctomycetota bacterium]
MQVSAIHSNRDRISWGLLVAAVLLGIFTVAKVAGFCIQRGRMQALGTLAGGTGDPDRLKQSLGEAKKTVDSLKQNNLFIKAPPKQNPVKQVEGILGGEALIAGKWYKVGDKIADAKIVAIAATQVEVEWDGKKTSFSPIASVSAGPPAPPAGPGGPPRKEAGPQPPKPPKAEVAKPSAPPTQDDPLAWMGVKLSPKVREKFLQMWNSIPDDQKEAAKDKWNSMPEDKKQEAIQQMERS